MNDNYYCGAMKLEIVNGKPMCEGMKRCEPHCICSRSKYETLEQFKKRTGREYPNNMAVYWRNIYSHSIGPWRSNEYGYAKFRRTDFDRVEIICANNDFGPPPDDYTPEKDIEV